MSGLSVADEKFSGTVAGGDSLASISVRSAYIFSSRYKLKAETNWLRAESSHHIKPPCQSTLLQGHWPIVQNVQDCRCWKTKPTPKICSIFPSLQIQWCRESV